VNVVGFSGATFTNAPNSGALFVVLEPFAERAKDLRKSASAIIGELYGRLAAIQEALIFVVPPPPVQGIGNAGGFRMMVEDRAGHGPQALQEAVGTIMRRAGETPGLSQVFSLFETATPELYLDIDRTKAQMLGVAAPEVFAALQAYIGSVYVNDFNLFGRTFRVTEQAAGPYRVQPRDILNIRVRNSSGGTVPLASFTTVRDTAGPCRVPRYNSIRPPSSMERLAPGYPPGQAMEIMEKLARPNLCPTGSVMNGRRLAFRQSSAAPATRSHVRLCAGGGFVFLVLAAQFEPNIAAGGHFDCADVPCCFDRQVVLRGQDNNILTQVGSWCSLGWPRRTQFHCRICASARGAGHDRLSAAVEARRGCGCTADSDDVIGVYFRRVAAGMAVGAGAES
jgi:multidrug efflux pump subunit AcrB